MEQKQGTTLHRTSINRSRLAKEIKDSTAFNRGRSLAYIFFLVFRSIRRHRHNYIVQSPCRVHIFSVEKSVVADYYQCCPNLFQSIYPPRDTNQPQNTVDKTDTTPTSISSIHLINLNATPQQPSDQPQAHPYAKQLKQHPKPSAPFPSPQNQQAKAQPAEFYHTAKTYHALSYPASTQQYKSSRPSPSTSPL